MTSPKSFSNNPITNKLDGKQKPDKYSVNYTISYGVDVSRKEIDELRASFTNEYNHDSIWNLVVNKDSSDKDLAKFIALTNPIDREAVDLDNLEADAY